MKKSTLSIALATALGVSAGVAQAATTITWVDGQPGGHATYDIFSAPSPTRSATFGVTGFLDTYSPHEPAPGAPAEFRMIDPSGAVGGGGHKSVIFPKPLDSDGEAATETWTFDSNSGLMTGVSGIVASPLNPGIAAPAGAAPNPGTNPSLQEDAPFFGPLFNFLAPTTTSLAGIAYGPGLMTFDSTDNFTILFNVLEAQWGGAFFPLGSVGTDPADGVVQGIMFDCTGALSGIVSCHAEELIDPAEDPFAAGFAGWTAQWDLHGVLAPVHVPVPAAVWLFGSGLVGLVGVARRKKA